MWYPRTVREMLSAFPFRFGRVARFHSKCHINTTLAVMVSSLPRRWETFQECFHSSSQQLLLHQAWSCLQATRRTHLSSHHSFGASIQFYSKKGLWLIRNYRTSWGFGVSGISHRVIGIWGDCIIPHTKQHCLFGFVLTPHSQHSWLLLEMFLIIIRLTLDLK